MNYNTSKVNEIRKAQDGKPNAEWLEMLGAQPAGTTKSRPEADDERTADTAVAVVQAITTTVEDYYLGADDFADWIDFDDFADDMLGIPAVCRRTEYEAAKRGYDSRDDDFGALYGYAVVDWRGS
jgi:hypothetical protein